MFARHGARVILRLEGAPNNGALKGALAVGSIQELETIGANGYLWEGSVCHLALVATATTNDTDEDGNPWANWRSEEVVF